MWERQGDVGTMPVKQLHHPVPNENSCICWTWVEQQGEGTFYFFALANGACNSMAACWPRST